MIDAARDAAGHRRTVSDRRFWPTECLALLAPTADELDLLRACLWQGAAARTAWERWQGAVGDPIAAIRHNVSGIKSLLPLLHSGLRTSAADAVAPPLHRLLAAAHAHETLRWHAYAAGCARAFDALAAADIPILALRGGVLAVSAYPEPAIRHSHDIDVLVLARDINRAAAVLQAAGFAAERGWHTPAHSLRQVSAEQVPIALHSRLYRLPYYGGDQCGVWERAVHCEVADTRVDSLSPADHLVYVCGHASCCASRDSLKWIADAWFLIRDPGLAWPTVLRAVEESRLTVPLAILLRVLAEHLDAPVPAAVLDELSAAAAAADRSAYELAIAGLRAGRRGRWRDLFRATASWRARFTLAHWTLAPSPTALRLGGPLRYPRIWPVYYLVRPSMYVARRIRRSEWLRTSAARPRGDGGRPRSA